MEQSQEKAAQASPPEGRPPTRHIREAAAHLPRCNARARGMGWAQKALAGCGVCCATQGPKLFNLVRPLPGPYALFVSLPLLPTCAMGLHPLRVPLSMPKHKRNARNTPPPLQNIACPSASNNFKNGMSSIVSPACRFRCAESHNITNKLHTPTPPHSLHNARTRARPSGTSHGLPIA